MDKILTICSREKCTGCSACYNACSRKCIALCQDAEGFFYPEINSSRCVDCGMCRLVCPINQDVVKRQPIAGYAFCSRNQKLLEETSSGGFFSWAARSVIDRGGVVIGAALNEENVVEHIAIENESGLSALRRSKYVQSRIGEIYGHCKELLDEQVLVLFSGTPCQVRGLLSYLSKPYENLITIDFVCHGVPSPGVFDAYLTEVASRKGASKRDIKEINFRDKSLNSAYSFSFSLCGERVVEDLHTNPYLRGFISDLYLRKSCHKCHVKSFSSGADYTMGDFWRVRDLIPSFPLQDVRGVSQVFVFNDKLGLARVKSSSLWHLSEFNCNDRRFYQKWIHQSVSSRLRKRFFSSYLESHPKFDDLVYGLTRKKAFNSIVTSLRILGKKIVAEVLGR